MKPFASPNDFDPELHLFLDNASRSLCEWLSNAEKIGPLPEIGEMPEVAPQFEGLSDKALIDDLRLIMDSSYHPSHPGALAHLDPPPLTASIAAELICAGLNNNLLAEELSPSLSKLERMLCKWFVERIGMPLSASGVAASGGTLSNLMALVVARQYSGSQNDPDAVVFASSDAHVSFAKAMRVMGLSPDSLQKIGTNRNGQLSISSLQDQLKLIRSQGRKCFAVVATAGTTVRGAVDPLVELSEFCSNEGLWLHVDGSIGGVFALSKTTSSIVQGIAKADSITLNPQKLLGITKTSSLLLVANHSSLKSAFATGLPYIEPAWGEDAHGGEMGLQGTRPAEVLKLWLGLRQLGEKGIDNLLELSLSRRSHFQRHLDHSRLQVIGGPLHLVSCTPKNADLHESSIWSTTTRKTLLEQKFMLSRPIHQNRYYLKAVFGNPHTQLSHLEKLADIINQSVVF